MPRPWQIRLPIRPNLAEARQVKKIARLTGLDAHAVVGRLLMIWVYAQDHASEAGVLEGKSKEWLDEEYACAGFAEAMAAAGWLLLTGAGVTIPEFDKHVSKRAIRRIEATERQQRARARKAATTEPLSRLRHAYVTPTSHEPAPVPPPVPVAPPKKRNPRAAEVTDARFWKFWRAYPKKYDQPKTYAAWAALNPDDALVETILAAVEAAKSSKQWSKDDGEFIPSSVTYLAGRRWQDRVEPGGGQPVQPGGRLQPRPGQFAAKRVIRSDEAPPPPPGPAPSLFDA